MLDDAISQFVASTRFDDLPASVVEVTKRSLLDALGVSLAASGLGEGCAAFANLARHSGGRPESTILGFGDKVPAPSAALANGALAHALDFEDAYDGAPIHPNAAVVAATLAEGEALGSSGQEVLAAIAVGCDLTCRLGLSIRVDMTKAGWYPPPILAAFGATAAVANLRRLSAEQVLDAFSLTLCQATCSAEIKYSPSSSIRAIRDAFPAQTGVLSARLAQDGVKGFAQPLDGKAGFLRLYSGGDYDPGVLLADLGRHFHGEDVTFKIWPACRGTHAFIEAALAVRARPGFDVHGVSALRVTGGPLQQMLMEPREQKLAPQTAINAKFSIPFALGLAFARGRVTLDDFDTASLNDPAILDIARRVVFEADPTWPHDRGAAGVLELQFADGKRVVERVDPALGHPDHPLEREALVQKFKDCAARAARPLTTPEADRWIAAVFSLDEPGATVRAIFDQ